MRARLSIACCLVATCVCVMCHSVTVSQCLHGAGCQECWLLRSKNTTSQCCTQPPPGTSPHQGRDPHRSTTYNKLSGTAREIHYITLRERTLTNYIVTPLCQTSSLHTLRGTQSQRQPSGRWVVVGGPTPLPLPHTLLQYSSILSPTQQVNIDWRLYRFPSLAV